MLTKRTNILFDEKTREILVSLAEKKKTSVGVLVRDAVKEKYLDEEEKIWKQRAKAFEDIEKIRTSIKHRFTLKEIKEMIAYGRKY